jgi:site-specific DNA-methyltransferase (adenine-specific)
LYRITKDGGVVVWVVADETIKGSETGTSFKQALFFKECGFYLYDTMIWYKQMSGTVGSMKRYESAFEYMFVLSKGMPKAANIIKDKPNKTSGKLLHGTIRNRDGTMQPRKNKNKATAEFGRRHNVWSIYPERNNKTIHPAVYPVQLAQDHIVSWSNEGDTVLDCFMGSGTTGIAAANTKRKFVGIELDNKYYEIAEQRINNAVFCLQ